MSDNVNHSLAINTELDIERFTHKSLVVHPGASGSYNVLVSNDGTTWITIAATVTTDAIVRSGPAATDLPHCVKLIKVTETVAGTDPTFFFQGHDPV